jgi:hypothetical protein
MFKCSPSDAIIQMKRKGRMSTLLIRDNKPLRDSFKTEVQLFG